MYCQIIIKFDDVDVTSAWTGMLNEDASSSREIVNDTELYFAFLIYKSGQLRADQLPYIIVKTEQPRGLSASIGDRK